MDTKENKAKAQEIAESKTNPMMYDLGVSWQTREDIMQAFEEEVEDSEQRQMEQQEKMTEEQARNLFREIFTDYGLDLERIYREGIEL